MPYSTYATDEKICKALCNHKIGDTVELLQSCSNENGSFEIGTKLCIHNIKLRNDVAVKKIKSNEINDFEADNDLFEYELTVPDTKTTLCCLGDKIDKVKLRLKTEIKIYILLISVTLVYSCIVKETVGIIWGAFLTFSLFRDIVRTGGIRDKPNIRRKNKKIIPHWGRKGKL